MMVYGADVAGIWWGSHCYQGRLPELPKHRSLERLPRVPKEGPGQLVMHAFRMFHPNITWVTKVNMKDTFRYWRRCVKIVSYMYVFISYRYYIYMIIWNYVAQYIYTTLSLYIVWLGADVIFSYVDALAERHSRFNIFQREEAFFEPHWKAASNACTCRTRLCSLWWWGHHHFWRSLVFNREQQVICIGMFSRICRTNTWMSVCTRLCFVLKATQVELATL